MSRLAQILKDKASDTMDNGIRNIHYQDIKPSPNNKFGIRDIDDLAEDIAATGLDHNIVIRPIDHPDFKYEIIAGERRYTAICKLIEQGNLTYEYIPAKVVKLDDNKSRKKLIDIFEASSSLLNNPTIHSPLGNCPTHFELAISDGLPDIGRALNPILLSARISSF